jgi:CPA2 family monovalent cation:H+ antiporter-2
LNWIEDQSVRRAIVCGGALIISLPFLIATYRKLQALSMLLADLGRVSATAGKYRRGVRRFWFELIPITSIVGILVLIAAVSARILPPAQWLAIVLLAGLGLAALFWNFFIRLHSRLQIALFKTMEDNAEEDAEVWPEAHPEVHPEEK